MRPLFNKGMGFDPNVFNQMFNKLKQNTTSKALTSFSHPQALVSQNHIQFSNLNPHAGKVSRTDHFNRRFTHVTC